MTVKDAARELGISPALVYALCQAKRIRHERHGLGRGKIVILSEALDEYRQRCTVPTKELPHKTEETPCPSY